MNKPFLLALALACAPLASAQISLGHVDDFQDGSLMNWQSGATLNNIANGGPMGAGDRFLKIDSDGGSGPGSRLGAFNSDQWGGNWIAAGVDSVTGWFNNLGQTDLHLRITFFRFPGDQTRWTSTNAQTLAAGSGWTQMTFSAKEADLTQVMGTLDYNTVLSGVSRFMIRHQSGLPNAEGDPIVGSMGMDNITAVPEPATVLTIALGLSALAARKRKKQ
jgi:hypothetical protein